MSAVDPWSHRGGEAHLGRCVLVAFSSGFFSDGCSRRSLSSKVEGQQHSCSRGDHKPSVGARCASLDGLRQWGSLLSGGELFAQARAATAMGARRAAWEGRRRWMLARQRRSSGPQGVAKRNNLCSGGRFAFIAKFGQWALATHFQAEGLKVVEVVATLQQERRGAKIMGDRRDAL